MRRNYFAGLPQFLRRWDKKILDPSTESARNRISNSGRINLEGSDGCSTARIYTRWDPEFLASLEPGVRQLTLLLIEKFNCITYSSCEGHPTSLSNKPSVRHVGVLPRDKAEFHYLVDRFSSYATLCNQEQDSPIEIVVKEEVLGTGDMNIPCIELVFAQRASEWERYFEMLDEAYELLVRELAKVEAEGWWCARTARSRVSRT
jgi:hypothetical protein